MVSKTVTKARQNKIRAILKKYGHDSKVVDALKLSTDQDLLESVLKVHGVSLEQYRRDIRQHNYD
jgi:hypothetical protein